jgi:hypothetical protein
VLCTHRLDCAFGRLSISLVGPQNPATDSLNEPR